MVKRTFSPHPVFDLQVGSRATRGSAFNLVPSLFHLVFLFLPLTSSSSSHDAQWSRAGFDGVLERERIQGVSRRQDSAALGEGGGPPWLDWRDWKDC